MNAVLLYGYWDISAFKKGKVFQDCTLVPFILWNIKVRRTRFMHKGIEIKVKICGSFYIFILKYSTVASRYVLKSPRVVWHIFVCLKSPFYNTTEKWWNVNKSKISYEVCGLLAVNILCIQLSLWVEGSFARSSRTHSLIYIFSAVALWQKKI